jgi:LacI family transcriptional regulator
MVTRADVARHARTSTAVVSYVINDGPRRVAPETRQRVLDAIAKLDYRPNRLAQALRGSRSRVLGLILPDISNPFYAELAWTIEDLSDRLGYTLVLGNSAQSPDREMRYVRTFLDLKIDGLFMISGSTSEELSRLATEIEVPFIIIDRRLNYMKNAFLFTTDGRKGAALAVQHLISQGHSRIVALTGPLQLGSERASGYAATMEEFGLEPRFFEAAKFDRVASHETARAILSLDERPSAIFATNDLAAISVIRAASDIGISVPNDLAVVGYDNIQEGEFSLPRLTTVAQPTEKLGVAAVQHLVEMIEGRRDKNFGIELISPRLIIRESCGSRLAPQETFKEGLSLGA